MKFLGCFFLLALSGSVWTKQIAAPRIIGGNTARAGQFPFMVAITVQTPTTQFFCGGALIDHEWVLTSAHCVSGASMLTIKLGSIHLTAKDPERVQVATSHVIPHPQYNPQTLENDVGLVKLRLPVELTDYIQPIKLAANVLPNMATPTALGWGAISDENPNLSEELNYVQLAVISNAECKITFGDQIKDNMVCVDGNYNQGACIGDSGSPLVVRPIGGQHLYHVGINIFYSGRGCESTDPSGYTRTAPYVPWIKNVTGLP